MTITEITENMLPFAAGLGTTGPAGHPRPRQGRIIFLTAGNISLPLACGRRQLHLAAALPVATIRLFGLFVIWLIFGNRHKFDHFRLTFDTGSVVVGQLRERFGNLLTRFGEGGMGRV